MNLLQQNKTVGLFTFLSGIIALLCVVLGVIAVNFNFEVFNNPVLLLTLPGISTEAIRWFMICDMFGYYMLLLPVIFYMHEWMKNKTAWCHVITFCGLGYVLIGSIGASILAVVWPGTLHAYYTAAPVEQQILKANFELVNNMVYNGMWNLLEMFFAGTWWLVTGILMFRVKYRAIAWIAIITGFFSLLDGLSALTGLGWLHEISLNVYLYVSIIWAIYLGILIYSRPFK